MRSLSCPQAEDWQTPVARHHYSLGAISLALAFVLNCRGSLRGSTSAIGLVCSLLGQQQTLPGHTSVRSWLLRVGLHQLTRPLEQADDDWIWIVDHTVQIGELKCLIILGLRHSAWLAQEDRTLEYENVDLIDLVPVRTSTGEVVRADRRPPGHYQRRRPGLAPWFGFVPRAAPDRRVAVRHQA
jgi:hypothetical protein